MGLRLIAGEDEVLETEPADIVHITGDFQLWQRHWGARQLLVGLFEMVGIEMGIAQRMDEFARASGR